MKDKIIQSLKTVKSLSSGVKQELLARSDKPEFPINSLPELNRKIWGLKKGLTVIASRTSQGKTSLCSQICYDTAKQGLPTLLLSLEDDVPTIIEKMFCQQRQVDNEVLQRGGFKHHIDIQHKYDDFINDFPKELLITCEIGSTFEEVNFLIDSLHPKPRVICVDYIQTIKATTKAERENLNEYIRQFRAICVKNNIAGILVSQMNRMAGGSEGVISLENLKGTGVLEEHSDMVILLHWEYFHTRNEQKKNDYTVIIAKNKRGRTGKHTLHYTPEQYRFNEVVPDVGYRAYKDE